MTEPAPSPQLLRSLGRLLRGLSALFWSVPTALVVCVHTAKAEWLQPFNLIPPLLATGALVYGLHLLGSFRKDEIAWIRALSRASLAAQILMGLTPFLYWWNKVPSQPFFKGVVELLVLLWIGFIYLLNPVLSRLADLLPDETLRQEARLVTSVNRFVMQPTLLMVAWYVVLARIPGLPEWIQFYIVLVERLGLWLVLVLVLLPVAMTMALIWKTKEVIFNSVFGPEH